MTLKELSCVHCCCYDAIARMLKGALFLTVGLWQCNKINVHAGYFGIWGLKQQYSFQGWDDYFLCRLIGWIASRLFVVMTVCFWTWLSGLGEEKTRISWGCYFCLQSSGKVRLRGVIQLDSVHEWAPIQGNHPLILCFFTRARIAICTMQSTVKKKHFHSYQEERLNLSTTLGVRNSTVQILALANDFWLLASINKAVTPFPGDVAPHPAHPRDAQGNACCHSASPKGMITHCYSHSWFLCPPHPQRQLLGLFPSSLPP